MRHAWANTLLLALVTAELVSGAFGLVSGSSDRAFFIVAHRVVGWGLVVLIGWKLTNIVGSLRLRRSGAVRAGSMALLVTLVGTLALGFAWSLVGPFSFWLFSGVSWHINLGVLLAVVLVWHLTRFVRVIPRPYWSERRSALRLVGIVAAGTLLWRAAEFGAGVGGLSGSNRRFTGSYEADSFSGNRFPLTSWLNDVPPTIGAKDWRLKVHGAVRRNLSIAYDDIGENDEMVATLDCTGGWHSTQVWRGASLASILDAAGIRDDVASVTVKSATGYYRRFSIPEASGYLLASRVGDEALSRGHGFPMRLVAPGKRGFEWVKWVVEIEVNTTSKWWQPPLPLQ